MNIKISLYPEMCLISKVQEEIREYCLNRQPSLLPALGSQGMSQCHGESKWPHLEPSQ